MFGKRLRQLRQEAQLTQDDLSTKCGVHSTYISMVERGEANITLDKMVAISNALDTSVENLLYYVPKNKKISSKESLQEINIMLKKLDPKKLQVVEDVIREILR